MVIELPREKRFEVEGGHIVVARIEPQCEQSPLLTEADCDHLATLLSPTRRAAWSTCRHILRRELGAEASLRYVGSGALILERAVADVAFVSISHSAEWVAVMFSKGRCGVDVESVERNFSRVASRYIAPQERQQFAEAVGPLFEAIMWSAEEALYKYGGQEGLDFIEDMVVTDINPHEQTLQAELYGVAAPIVHYHLFDNQILCYLNSGGK